MLPVHFQLPLSLSNPLNYGFFWLQKLLPVHTSRLQCEEASAAAIQRRRHCGDDLRGSPQPYHGETNRQLRACARADADLFLILMSPQGI